MVVSSHLQMGQATYVTYHTTLYNQSSQAITIHGTPRFDNLVGIVHGRYSELVNQQT